MTSGLRKGIWVNKKDLEQIEKAAKKDRRSFSSFLVLSALEQAKKINKEHG